MSEWITDRRPTELDCDRMGMVWVSNYSKTDHVARKGLSYVGDLPWQPTNLPEPYVPPKPVRREWWIERKDIRDCWRAELHHPGSPVAEGHIHVREVLPNDPTPEVIEWVAKQLEDGPDYCLRTLAAKLRGESDA